MLVITSLENAEAAYAAHRPSTVISLLSEDEEAPRFDGLATHDHVVLYMDEESCAAAISRAAQARANDLLKFINQWDAKGSLLIHCNRGVARSGAAAFIILCALDPDADEAEILARLRKAAPHIDPCPLFVSYADAALAREGRMLDAVEDLGPPTPALSAPTAFLPLTHPMAERADA